MKTAADFRPYQRDALDFVLAQRRCYLAAKAGSGKTAVGIGLMETILFDAFETNSVLVVAPKRVVKQWPQEARKWASGARLRFGLYVGDRTARTAALEACMAGRVNVLVVSFEFFPELIKAVPQKRWPFGLVIFDEASRLRSGGRQGSVTWKAMNAVSAKTDCRIVLMSGSPRPGTAHELYAPVYLLDRGERLGATLGEFRSTYLQPDKVDRRTGQVWSWQLQAGAEPRLYQAVKDLFFAVSPDLGLPFVVIDREINLPPEAHRVYADLERDQVVDLDALEAGYPASESSSSAVVVAASAGVAAGKLHQLTQGAVFVDEGWRLVHDEKLDELEQIIDEVEAPVIVCIWYRHDRERVLARFPDAVDITTAEGLAAALAGQVRIAVLHPASAAHGIDGLQYRFSTIIWFALPASFELYEQANARVIRSGQAETVRVYRILAANGLDPRIAARLDEKSAGQQRFFDTLEQEAA